MKLAKQSILSLKRRDKMKVAVKHVVFFTIIVSMVLAACTPAAPQPAAPADTGSQPAGGQVDTGAKPVKVTWATLAGFYTDWAKSLAEDFTAKTGIQVEIVEMDLPTMYEKIVLDVVGGTGTYDIITWNVSWKSEWANNEYIYPLDDFIARDAGEVQIDDVSQALLMVSGGWKGKIYGLPYYTFTPGIFYRCDLFEDPQEKAAFAEKYGYELTIPQSYEQMADIAEFFRRNPGDTLKGEPVGREFYGIGLMAGRFTHIFDEMMTIAWTMGGDVINDDGSAGVNDPIFVDALNLYVNDLLPYAPPGSLSGGYDFVVGQFNSGIVAMTGPMYLDQWPNAVKVEENVPGSEACMAALPGGGKTWAGAFTLGIAKTTAHPEESWQFLKWITGPEAQRRFAEGGGSTTRLSILNDRAFYEPRREQAGHFPVLVPVLEHAAKCWYTNYIHVPQAAKIYEEAPAWLSAAATGEMTPQAAMDAFASRITEFCGGNCTVMNEGFPKPAPGCEKPFEFDPGVQLRK
jgi:multiple sugar transport system substrate-binding protein